MKIIWYIEIEIWNQKKLNKFCLHKYTAISTMLFFHNKLLYIQFFFFDYRQHNNCLFGAKPFQRSNTNTIHTVPF